MVLCDDIDSCPEPGRLLQIENFDQRDAGGVIFAAHHRGVAAWRERLDDRGFGVIRRGESGRLNEGFL